MRHPSVVPVPTSPQSCAPDVVPWELAWQEALYGGDGFYRRSAPAAHFATSAQGIAGAGALLAEAVLALAREYACTRVVDLGCGRGELLAELRALAPENLHLTGVDVTPHFPTERAPLPNRARPPARPSAPDGDISPGRARRVATHAPTERTGWRIDDWLVSPGGAALPEELRGLEDTLVLGHEWLDVVPCPVVVRDESGAWRKVLVDRQGHESAGPRLSGDELAWADRWLGPEVRRAEIGLPRDRAAADLLSRVASGVVVIVDYGHTREDRPAGGTLTGYRAGRQVEPVPDGSGDLTAHVAVDSVAATSKSGADLHRQRDLLCALLPDPVTPVPHDLARRNPTAYLRAVARRSALAALSAPGGLGDFWWVVAPAVAPARRDA